MSKKRGRGSFEGAEGDGGPSLKASKKTTEKTESTKSPRSSSQDEEDLGDGLPENRKESLYEQSVRSLKKSYVRTYMGGRQGSKDGDRWFGKVWDPDMFKMRAPKCQYTEFISENVLHNWRQLNRKGTLPRTEPCAGAYNEVITKMCRCILDFRSLPRSRPTYKIHAAKHPLGAILHGQDLPTGETLQLVASIKRNTPIWKFVATCLRKLLHLAEKERDLVQKGFQPDNDVMTRWDDFVTCIGRTVSQLRKRGVTKSYRLERMNPQHVEAMCKRAKRSLKNEKLKDIIDDIRCVFCGKLPKGHSGGDARHQGQYLVHVPHEFEFYLKEKVIKRVKKRYPGGYDVRKEEIPFPRRPGHMHPDIVIRHTPTNRIIACIDAKLKNCNQPQREDEYQMLTYTVGLEADNKNNKRGGEKVKGVVFVAVYNDKQVKDERTGDYIRFIFCSVNKASNDDKIEEEMTKKVDDALEFLLGPATMGASF